MTKRHIQQNFHQNSQKTTYYLGATNETLYSTLSLAQVLLSKWLRRIIGSISELKSVKNTAISYANASPSHLIYNLDSMKKIHNIEKRRFLVRIF